MLRHLPNAVTAFRGLLGPVIAVMTLQGWLWTAFWLFILAICTDLVDGYLARRFQASSKLGEALDGVADKVLTDFCWAAMWAAGRCPGWLAGLTLARDAIVCAAWLAAWRTGRRWKPSPVGQIMVAFEGVAIPVLLFPDPGWCEVHWLSVGVGIGAITLALSAVSLVHYALNPPQPVEAAL